MFIHSRIRPVSLSHAFNCLKAQTPATPAHSLTEVTLPHRVVPSLIHYFVPNHQQSLAQRTCTISEMATWPDRHTDRAHTRFSKHTNYNIQQHESTKFRTGADRYIPPRIRLRILWSMRDENDIDMNTHDHEHEYNDEKRRGKQEIILGRKMMRRNAEQWNAKTEE